MNRQLLEQPFAPQEIKQRDGNFGKTIEYIEGHAVIKRLNDAFDGSWSFQVKSHEILESEVVVLGELKADGIVKSQFGSSTVTRAKNSGDIVSLAGDLKAASTDCLKKCATLFGVGLHLYSGNVPASQPAGPIRTSSGIQDTSFSSGKNGDLYCPATPGKMRIAGGNGRGRSDHNNGGNNGTGNGKPNGRLSQKQQSFLVSLAEDRGYDRKRLDDMSRERYGVVVNFLSKNDASSFIGELTSN